ncbi:MAG: hypothetical protein A2831_03620 [Candidatus Yanofskybacteria bacterium RIFCSPHIGHO2_01_FULL_44_17]|uniref:Uncharacterized protein n=1 Tax=Candidatus Yanofskybacteria bacterium RIFCSPHIGHO2_01_FULL_44_17 TaxID=1802668 RepID=A0A1F8EZG4_9BACT|nr:MAG: hypothetical protein A2831_03620 [Candidatus Yanofskybacteria bacterium RIFCSPHIGHO2_01_FULL_44_17]
MLFGTTVVNVFMGIAIFLILKFLFSGNGAITLSTCKKISEYKELLASLHGMGSLLHHFLASIKKFLCNSRFMFAFVELTIEFKCSIVEWVIEQHLNIGIGQYFLTSAQ